MDKDPPRGRLLQIADTQNCQRVLQPQRALVAAVSEQAMKAGADSERAKDVVADREPQHTPPTEEVRHESERNQQMEESNAEDVGPDDPALLVDQRRSRDRPLQCHGREQLFRSDVSLRRWPTYQDGLAALIGLNGCRHL